MQESSLKTLFDTCLSGHADEVQKDQFFQMVEQPRYYPELKQLMDEYLRSAQAEELMPEPMFRKIMQNIGRASGNGTLASQEVEAYPQPAPVKSMYKRLWPYAAAMVLIIAGVWFFASKNNNGANQPSGITKAADIRPGGDKATLTMSDGSKILLENREDGVLSEQDGMKVTKNKGTLYYSDNGNTSSGSTAWNTVSTPRGGKYKLRLPDGSWAWLNAASSIRFPVAFGATERKVEITGEVYFAVKDSAGTPFIVNARDNQIRVLGTQFNVNAYDHENQVEVTLVDGNLQVRKGTDSILLKPGQQAVSDDNLIIRDSINQQKIYAWKEGFFYFYDDSLDEVLQQLALWYNIDVKFEGAIPDIRISGRISRDVTLETVMDVLTNLGIRYRMEARRTLVILPSNNRE